MNKSILVFSVLLLLVFSQTQLAYASMTVEYLVVGGGGGSGNGGTIGDGGGGGGGYRTASGHAVSVGQYTITVGAGGASFTKGGDSTFDTITSIGGGRGGSANVNNAGAGGSGGGAGGTIGGSPFSGGAGTGGQGNNGGSGDSGAGSDAGGGGGGAGAVGGNNGGAGGAGLSSSITGSAVTRSGGGGGEPSGAGGAGGGASASAGNGGGGGGGFSASGITGGAGVVILRYLTDSFTATGGTITTDGSYTIHTFTTSGIFEVLPPIPSAPLNPILNNMGTHTATANWDTPTDADNLSGYRVYINDAIYNNDTGSTDTTLPITGLTSGTLQSLIVHAWNGTGAGINSTSATNYTLNTPPTLNKVNIINATAFELFYGINGTFNGIQIDIDEFPYSSFTTFLSNSTSSALSLIVNGFTDSANFAFKIFAHNMGGTSEESNQIINGTTVEVNGTLSYVYTNVGDIFLLNGTLSNIIAYPSPSTATQIQVIDNGTLTATKAISDTLTNGSSTAITFIPIQIDDDLVHEIYLSLTATNDTGSVIINSSSQNLTREYEPDYIDAVTPSEGEVYWTGTRTGGDLTLEILRNKNAEPFQIECAIYTADQARLGASGVPTWMNHSNIYYFIDTVSTGSSQTLYAKCYNSSLLFQTFFPSNGTDTLIGGFESLDSVIGNWMGVPIVTLFIIFLASMATKTNSGITILALLIAIGIMGGIGLFTMDTGLWALMMIMGTLAIIGAKLGFD